MPDISAEPQHDQPLRIAVIGGRGVPSNYSGVETVFAELYSRMAQHGHRVTVYCRPGTSAGSRGVHRGIRQVRLPAPGGRNFETLSHSLASLTHALTFGDDGRRFDLVCLYTLAPNLFAPLCRLAGVPLVAHVQGLDWQRAKWRGLGARVIHAGEKSMVRFADGIMAPASFLCDYYARTYGRHCTYVPNGVPYVDQQPDAQLLAALGLRPGGYVACIGRLVPEKRVHDVITAFRQAASTEMRLAVVGDGSTTPDYVRQLHKVAGDDARIVFTGLQRGAALASLFAGARLFVSASELEGMPVTMLEAMSHGLPVIASRIPPHEQMLGEAGADLLFEPGDTASLTRLLREALPDNTRLTAVGAALRKRVRQHFDWTHVAQQTLAFYRHTIASHKKGRHRDSRQNALVLPTPAGAPTTA